MLCPRCEEETLRRVILRTTGDAGYLCDFCETFWFEGREITKTSGHPFEIERQGEGIEYTLEELDEKDQEHRTAQYSTVK